MQEAKVPRILLIDDDPVFCNLMAEVAKSWQVPLDAYESLMDLGSIGRISGYDVAIIDYRLHDMTGIEIAEYLQAFFSDTPMVLVSALDDDEIPETNWPAPIAKFMNKKAGCSAILLAALSLASWKEMGGSPDEPARRNARRSARPERPG